MGIFTCQKPELIWNTLYGCRIPSGLEVGRSRYLQQPTRVKTLQPMVLMRIYELLSDKCILSASCLNIDIQMLLKCSLFFYAQNFHVCHNVKLKCPFNSLKLYFTYLNTINLWQNVADIKGSKI